MGAVGAIDAKKVQEDGCMKKLFPTTIRPEDLAAAVQRGELPQEEGESEQEYRAFMAFCTTGPSASLEEIGKAVGMSGSGMSRLSRRRQWLARIERWQIEREQKQQSQMERVQASPVPTGQADAGKWQEDAKSQEWAMHIELMTAGREALERWKASGRVPMLSEVAKLLELSSRLGRLAAGLPLEHTEVSGKNGAPIRIDIGAALVRAYGPAEVVDVETAEG
jgi:hypothetical protein